MRFSSTTPRAIAPRTHIRLVLVALLACLAGGSEAQTIPPLDDLTERQDAALDAYLEETQLDLTLDLSTASDSMLYQQSRDLIAELEGQSRQLPNAAGITYAEADAHLYAILERLGVMMAGGPPWSLLGNRMITYNAAFRSAYLLHQYPEVWSEATLELAHGFFREAIRYEQYPNGAWVTPADLFGDSRAACTGARLLAGEVFDDAELKDYARSEILRTRARIARGDHYHMQPHYTAPNLQILVMMHEVEDPELRAAIRDVIEWILLLPGHLYLPGGGLGAPKNRTKGPTGVGGVGDPAASDPAHLPAVIDALVQDPDVAGGIDPLLAAVSAYAVPEVIRSIFLDKGDGYRFRHNQVNHTDPEPLAAETHTYPLGWQGWSGGAMAEPLGAIPWETVVLPGGDALLGIMYGGEQTGHSVSSGTYLRRPGSNTDFSILFHYQRAYHPNQDGANPTEDPEVDLADEEWNRERETPWRRMMHHRTAVTLWDVDYPGWPQYEYTLAHVPNYEDPLVGIAEEGGRVPSVLGAGYDWIVGRTGSAYVAYLPLGQITETLQPGLEWSLLEIDGPVSGNVTEIATTDQYATLGEYLDDLEDRHVAFTGSSATDAAIEVDVRDPVTEELERIRLEYDPEIRLIDGNPQPDASFLLSDGHMESPFVTWNDAQFSLHVSRTGYDPVTLDFGDPVLPTAPHNVRLTHSGGLSPVTIRWDHGWDDLAITEYVIYRSDLEAPVATVPGTEKIYHHTPPDDGTGLTQLVQYSILARDGETQPNESASLGYSRLIEVPGDGTPPSVPEGLAGPANILTWDPSTDDSGVVAGYEVYRDDVLLGTVTEPAYQDDDQEPETAYVYEVAAFDAAGNVSERSDPLLLTTGLDASAPTPPVITETYVNHLGVFLGWDEPFDDVGVVEYEIRKGGVAILVHPNPWLLDVDVTQGDTYVYEVVARDAAGNTSLPSAPVVVEIPDVTPPTAPGLAVFQVAPAPLEVVLFTLTESDDNVEVAGHELLRDGVLVGPLGEVLPHDYPGSPGTFSYTARAIDTSGNVSPESAPVEVVMPDVTPPSTPTIQQGWGNTQGAYLDWSEASDDVGVDHYVVTRDGQVRGTTSEVFFLDTPVEASTTHQYRVRAVDAAGNESPHSAAFPIVIP